MKVHRLEEIIRLIQVVGLGETFGPSNHSLNNQLHGIPKSANSWVELADEHPEFFRTALDADDPLSHSLSLLARFYRVIDGNRPPLPWMDVKTLIDIAINLHERQVRNRERRKVFWTVIGTIVAAIIAGAFAKYTGK